MQAILASSLAFTVVFARIWQHATLLQRTAPSWLYMIDRGAPTIWEDWEGIDADGTAHNSLNHYSKGAVIRFPHTHTLGLRQSPGSVA